MTRNQRCGRYKRTVRDVRIKHLTWKQVSYRDADETSRAWVAARRANRLGGAAEWREACRAELRGYCAVR